MLVKGTIGLGIRERKPVTNAGRFEHKAVKTWINELPKANVGETSRQVYQLLLDSNQLLLSSEQRNNLLSNTNDIVSYISAGLKKHYVGQSVALNDKQQKVSNFSQALDVEVAIGYKSIIEDLIVDEKYTSNLLVIAVNACLYYFYKIQTRCYQLYRDLPKGMWREIHILYQLAEQNQFHDKRITFLDTSMSIYGTYKNILLLSTINPNQMRQQEISQIAEALPKVSSKIKLSGDPEADYDFLVNLNSDAQPFHSTLLSGEVQASYRGFSLKETVNQLEQELQHKPKDQRILGLTNQSQHHVLSAWGDMTTRVFARTAAEGTMRVSVGLASSHFLISETLYGEDFETGELTGEKLIDSLEGSLRDAVVLGGDENEMVVPGGPRKTNTEWNKKKNSPMLKEDSMWDSLYRNKQTRDTQDDTQPYQFIEKAKEENTSAYNYKDATIINISPGGFCLMLDSPLPAQTQTGEIIGLLEPTDDEHINWNIGTIRWMRRKPTGELDLGIQLIAPNGLPVRGQLRTSHSNDNHYQRCLKLPAIESIGQPETLLTSPLPFREQAKVRLQTQEGSVDILLKNEIFSGHSFKQFTYDVLEDDSDGDMSSNDDDFDTVWKLI